MSRKRFTAEQIIRILREADGKFRDELLNGEIFYTLKEAQVLIEE
jgi:hypothetical protein